MTQLLDKYTMYAIRANDIYPTVSRIINADLNTRFSKTKDIGALSSIIKVIKNAPSVIEKERLLYLAANIGIDTHAFDFYLKDLHDMEFINVKNNNKVEITIPHLSLDVYETLGKKLEENKPSEQELKHFELINTVADLPAKVSDLNINLDIQNNDMNLFKRLGTNCGYLNSYVSPADGKEIIYSPIYWDENPESLFTLVDKYNHETVFNKISTIRNFQGKPVKSLATDSVLTEAVSLGCLPTNAVDSAGGKQFFVFTPTCGVKKYEKDIIKKARQIVSCVRYGQEFAKITKIRSIMAVLNKLLRDGYIGDHSENIHQYAMLINMGLVYPVKACYGHKIYLNDTEENRRVFAIAIELLQGGTIADNDPMLTTSELKSLFNSDKSFNEELVVINNVKKEVPNDSHALQRIGDILRGVDEDVFK